MFDGKRVSAYKNRLSVLNLSFCLIFITFYSNDSMSVKAWIGLLIATLGPIIWNRWLYDELCQGRSRGPIISFQMFLTLGLFMAILMSAALIFGVLRGTL